MTLQILVIIQGDAQRPMNKLANKRLRARPDGMDVQTNAVTRLFLPLAGSVKFCVVCDLREKRATEPPQKIMSHGRTQGFDV